MKLTIDFTNKLITVEEQCNLDDLVKKIKEMLPDDWKEFKLNTNIHFIEIAGLIFASCGTATNQLYPHHVIMTHGDTHTTFEWIDEAIN